ncbi:hypothetical protein BJF78_10560 [Pseudonocardia sp. CNS-139]|nr:hypothetical protein BJF78_10560 [Pseudonocardia sp. CNS-139]
MVSTYPMISGGLAWLRRRGRLPGRAVALVTDVAVHPYWVWPELDETWTLLPASRDQARALAPAANVRVVPAAVDPRFRPGDRQRARAELGLRPDAVVVLVTGGSLGFGGLDRLTAAVLAAGDGVQAVVLCGRNARLRTRLLARRVPANRLVVRGWTDRVAEHITAATWCSPQPAGCSPRRRWPSGGRCCSPRPSPGTAARARDDGRGRVGAGLPHGGGRHAGGEAVAQRPAGAGPADPPGGRVRRP